MEDIAIASTSSKVSSAADSKIHTFIELDKTIGPSIRKIIAIKRTTQNNKVLSLRDVTPTIFNNPDSFDKSNVEQIFKKYSSERKKSEDQLERSLNTLCGKLPFKELEQVFHYTQTDEILYRLFVTSVYAINNYFGKPGPERADSNDLFLYVNKLFPIGKHYKNAYYDAANGIPPPKFLIDLVILEARGLKSLGEYGFLFCKIWMNGKSKWAEMTKAVASNKHPIWNVRFFFPIENMMEDVIIIEMFYTEKDLGSNFFSNTRHSIPDVFNLKKSFGRRYSKIPSLDLDAQREFQMIGKTEMKIRNVYSEGVDEWLLLESSSEEYGDVYLHIQAKFRVPETKCRLDGLKRHLMLLKICVEYRALEANNSKPKITRRENLLSRSALALIFLHSVISNLTPAEDIISRFVIIKRIGLKTNTVTTELVYKLLHETVECLREFPDDFMDNQLQQMLENETKSFHRCCFQFISSLHSNAFEEDSEMLSEFEFSLRSLNLCEEIIEDIPVAPLMVLKSETINWIEIRLKEIEETAPEGRASFIIDFLNYLIQYQTNVDQVIEKVFHGNTLTHLIYKQLDGKISDLFKSYISEFCRISMYAKNKSTQDVDETRKMGIELFSKMKEFVTYVSNTTLASFSDLRMSKFREWFGRDIVIEWFEWRLIKAETEIEEVVKVDVLDHNYRVSFDLQIKHSDSAEQTCEIIQKYITDLWDLVSFVRSEKCDKMFLDSLYSCCQKYRDLLMEIIVSRKLVENFYLDGRRHLCVLANNLWYLVNWAEKTVQDNVGKTPPDASNVSLSLKDSCKDICSCVIDKYMTDILHLINSIVENKEVNKKANILNRYAKYLKRIIWEEISVDLASEVFKLTLRRINKLLVRLLWQYVEEREDTKENERFFESLLEILTVTKEVCSITSNLEENVQIWDSNYESLLSTLTNKTQRNFTSE